MNQLSSRAVLLSLVTLVLSAPASARSARENATRVVEYAMEIVDSKRILEGLTDRNQHISESQKQRIKAVIHQFDFGGLATRLAHVYIKYVTESDINRCISFIDSQIGRTFHAATQSSEFTRDPGTFFNALSPGDKNAVNTFMTSNCLFVNIPEKGEMQRTFGEYLADQICSYSFREDKDMYSALARSSYCPRQ